MEFRLLGRVEIRDGDQSLPLSGTKQRTVLAALLLARGEVVSDSRLSRLLWGWNPPATVNAQLYTQVSRLRQLLGDRVSLTRVAPGYLLDIGSCPVDLDAFERRAAAGRRAIAAGEWETARRCLRDALSLWSGPPLSGVTDHLAEAEAPGLAERRLVTLEHRIEADLECRAHHQLVAELTALTTEFPLRERLRGQLMTALAATGRKGEALRVYHHGRRLLADELGVDPGRALQAVFRSVLDDRLTGAASRAVAIPRMLPQDIADFTGREPQISRVLTELARGTGEVPASWRPRRAVILGMPGVGKTALAVRAAHAVRAHFPHGQLVARLRSEDGVPRPLPEVLTAFLRALGRPGSELAGLDPDALTHRYREAMAGRRILVLLDDVADEAHLAPLLPDTPGSAVVVTSRTPLTWVAGARITVLEPLGEHDAMELLAATAGETRIRRAEGDARALLAHCAGLPLAIRAVGTRLASRPQLQPGTLARRLADERRRLDELRLGALDVGGRLRSARDALDAESAAALGLLSDLDGATADGLDADTAAAALMLPRAEAEGILESLVDAALLQTGRHGYRLHPLVRLASRPVAGVPAA